MTTPNFSIEDLPSAEVKRKGVWYHFRTFCRRYPLGAIGAAITLVFVFCAVFAEYVTGMDPYSTNAATSLAAPGGEHMLGADVMGRDVFSRIVYGARISLMVGVGSTFVGCLFGVIIGLASGYLLGWFDLFVQRIIDMMQALPLLVMALVL
jgi:peptide/nickel transport system permease protein